MTRPYPGFQEWLLTEMNEHANDRPLAINPVKPSTLALVDKATAELRFRDKVWQENRDRLYKEWLKNRPTLTLAEYVNQVGEQVRRGK